MSANRVSAIIIDGDKILLIRRVKNLAEYYVLPGGSAEGNESILTALSREIKEETGLSVIVEKELWQINSAQDPRTQHIFLIKQFEGILRLGKPEINRQSKNNQYHLEWHNIKELSKLKFFPEELKDKIIKLI